MTFKLKAAALLIALECGIGWGVVHASNSLQDAPQSPVLLPAIAAAMAFLLSAAGAVWLSDHLSQRPDFNALAGNTKNVIVFVLCSAIGLALYEGSLYVARMPEALAWIDQRLQLIIPLVTWLISQFRYGREAAKRGIASRAVVTPAWNGEGWPTSGGG
jgi:hypothetical protein